MKITVIRRLVQLVLAIYIGCIAGANMYYAIHNSGHVSIDLESLNPQAAFGSVGMAFLLPLLAPKLLIVLCMLTSIFYLIRGGAAWFLLLPFGSFAALIMSVLESWRVG
jgi:hypothetical protein